MDFSSLWNKVEELNALPTIAILDIPTVISEETKTLLANHAPEDVARILKEAIDEINGGSVRSLNELIKNRLQ